MGRQRTSRSTCSSNCSLSLQPEQTDLRRRVLILAADHGVTESTYAVRMVAKTGVTPWRSVSVGLALAVGRQSKFARTNPCAGSLRKSCRSRTRKPW